MVMRSWAMTRRRPCIAFCTRCGAACCPPCCVAAQVAALQYKIHNAEVLFRGDHSVDEFIDVIEGNRKYIKCLYVYNKIDTVTIEEVRAPVPAAAAASAAAAAAAAAKALAPCCRWTSWRGSPTP